MLPKLYRTSQTSAPWLVVYSDATQRDRDGKPRRIRFRFAQEADARKKLGALTKGVEIGGVVGLTWSMRTRADAEAARQILDAAGLEHISLTEIARQHVKTLPPGAQIDHDLEPLLEEFIETKTREERRQTSIDNLQRRVKAWLDREKLTTVASITDAALRSLKLRKGVSAQTRINDMAAVSSFLSYLTVDRRILAANPLTGMSRPTRDIRMPRVLTPEQAKALLAAAQEVDGGRLLRYFTLCLLAGLRPGEAARLDPAAVVLTRGGRISVTLSKRRRRGRAVPISATFRAWWAAAPETPAPLFDWERDRVAFDQIREQAGLIQRGTGGDRKKLTLRLWQDDICRHTWISWRLAELKDEAQVALEAGTSVQMIHEHYLQWLDNKSVKALAGMRPAIQAQKTA